MGEATRPLTRADVHRILDERFGEDTSSSAKRRLTPEDVVKILEGRLDEVMSRFLFEVGDSLANMLPMLGLLANDAARVALIERAKLLRDAVREDAVEDPVLDGLIGALEDMELVEGS